MKKIIIIIAAAALVFCLVLASLADHQTNIPQNGPSGTGTASTPTDPSPSNTTPDDIENGLGWG